MIPIEDAICAQCGKRHIPNIQNGEHLYLFCDAVFSMERELRLGSEDAHPISGGDDWPDIIDWSDMDIL